MKIGIIGSGNMGRTLGLLWVAKGHEVFFGSRNERDLRYIEELLGHSFQCGSLKEAILFGDILLYSLRDTLPSALASENSWSGKIIIDCNDGEIPSDFNYAPNTESYTEKYQKDLPASKVVKAFNTIAQEFYFHDFETIKKSGAVGFIAGDDTSAKETVAQLVLELGLTPLDAGLSYNARQLEVIADTVRLLMIRNGLGPFLFLTAQTLPPIFSDRLGERQSTKYK